MVFDPWIGDIVSIPCLQGRCKRDPGRHKTPNPGVEKRDPGVESLLPMLLHIRQWTYQANRRLVYSDTTMCHCSYTR